MPRPKNPNRIDCTIPLDAAHVQHLRELAVQRSKHRARVLYGDLVREAVEEKLVRLGLVQPSRVGPIDDAANDERQLTLRPRPVAPPVGRSRRV